MSDRHEKWVRVERGTAIPAGQPYRVEWDDGKGQRHASEYPGREIEWRPSPMELHQEWFIDSSWKTPLELPTEPTWGIAVNSSRHDVGRWFISSTADGRSVIRNLRNRHHFMLKETVLDFIPLTDEQIARIEAAR